MCGICGKLAFDGQPVEASSLSAMLGTIRHRGPDDEGAYRSGPVGLGHRRLSIIDLGSGHQPLSNEDGSVWVVFNGEIYNYKELRAFLISKGHQFRTTSDTEVIVHLYEEFGEASVERLFGMFAYALWDEKKKTLLLARDRVGIKPLYYAMTPTSLLFASEVKAILGDSSVRAEANPAAIDRFLTFLYTPGDETVFQGVSKLLPGHYMVVQDGKATIRRYWDLLIAESKVAKSPEDYANELTDLLAQTVRDHMIADVPVGVLLSGGVDSTAMLSFAVEQTDKEISTFTIGFDGQQCTDERPYAKLAAKTYGTRHYDTTITAGDFLNSLPHYVWHMEEPVCEPPAIALYHVTKLARENVKVLISGEGGDEAFAGYQNYRNLFWLEVFKGALGPFAKPMSGLMTAVGKWSALERISKYAPLMNIPFEGYYYSRTSDPFTSFNQFKNDLYTADFKTTVGTNGRTGADAVRQLLQNVKGAGLLNRMLYVDTKTWLPDDLLIKADKMTMANSLELRVPLLDHRVLEFAAALPRRFKLRGLNTKYLLKKALSSRIPKAIVRRRKTGFPVPYDRWIRGEFKEIFRDILMDRRTLERGYFQKSAIQSLLHSNSNGRNSSKELFSLVVLELWHRIFVEKQASVTHL